MCGGVSKGRTKTERGSKVVAPLWQLWVVCGAVIAQLSLLAAPGNLQTVT